MQFWMIATLMVVATTATLVVPLFWRARTDAMPSRRRWFAFAFATATVIPLIALGFYAWSGKPELAIAPPQTAAGNDIATTHARAALRGGDGQDGGDLDAAIGRLSARLAANPNDAAGWRLLAQSYQFQGRTAEAAEANKHAQAAERGDTVAPPAAPMPMVANLPLDAAANRLAQKAEEHRRRREFPQAIAVFSELAKRGTMNADLWADYADALGGARGKLDAEAVGCIDAALRLEPAHTKALWLRASWQTQQQDFAAALITWQRLAAVLPPDSPDARIIAANLEEARGILSSGAARADSQPATALVALRGSVRLDPRLVARVGNGSVLFVFARAADERGPPLAVWRTTVGSWPLNFVLDDRNAMMPDRKLSDFTRVILEARISRSGNALPQPGDLRGVSTVLDPHTAASQQLTISEEVGATTPAQGS
jgi:cytochrome c-type biogenesis protein CcmH